MQRKRLTKEEKEELFRRVDLRKLTGKPIPPRPDQAVRIRCPVHGGENDLAIFPNHCYCFSAKCGFRERAFDTAAILLGYYKKTVTWASDFYWPIIDKLRELAEGGAPEPAQTQATISQERLERMYATYHETLCQDPDLCRRFLGWRGYPVGTITDYGIGHTGKNWSIPVFDRSGTLVTLRFRRDDSDPGGLPDADVSGRPKYWGISGHNSESYIYGLNTLPPQPFPHLGTFYLLVEGEFDCIAAQVQGLPALSFVNGAGMKSDRIDKLQTLAQEVDYIITAFDQDEAGQNGVWGYETGSGKHVLGVADIVEPEQHINLIWGGAKDANELYIKKPRMLVWLVKKSLRERWKRCGRNILTGRGTSLDGGNTERHRTTHALA